MLHLSDNELDRLSREAASEYDPEVITNAKAWDNLEYRLDRDLGRVRPNFFRSIRRFPFYYAPALILVLAGISYFISRPSHSPAPPQAESSGSSPTAVLKDIRPSTPAKEPFKTQNSTNDKATSTPLSDRSKTNDATGKADPSHTASPGGNLSRTTAPGADPSPSGQGASIKGDPAGNGSRTTPTGKDLAGTKDRASNVAPSTSVSSANTNTGAAGTAGVNTVRTGKNSNGFPRGARPGRNHGRSNVPGGLSVPTLSGGSGQGDQRDLATTGVSSHPTAGAGQVSKDPKASSSTTLAPPAPEDADLAFSVIQRPGRLSPYPVVDDSALRNYDPKEPAPVSVDKKNTGLHINRSLQLGFVIAPDFASVNSLAGDRPGLSLGLTIDYQIMNRWYLSTGLIYTKKNYSAGAKDYHAPYDYYRNNNMYNVDLVKGTFNMLEIPINLRYDYSIVGNTTFFATAGLSSYLLTHENCNYYFDLFGRGFHREFDYKNRQTRLFSTVNLSMGVETGISNSVSLQVAPYLKLPIGNLGFGQVQLSSMGISFGVKYAPVLSRKRHF